MVKKIILFISVIPTLLTASNLGDFYVSRELYFEAVTEYKRQLFFDNSGKQDELLYKIADACYKADQKYLAEEPLIDAITNAEYTKNDKECLKLLATIHWDHYDYEAMRQALNLIIADGDSIQSERVKYISAWSYIYQAQWENGIRELETVHFIPTEDLIVAIRNVKTVPQKSKRLASTMSNIIPGSGQLYSGDHQNALYSFLLVGSVEASIIWNIIEKAYFIAATKYLFLFSRYSMGGLKNLARRIDLDNVDRIGYYLKDIAQKYPDPIELLHDL